MMTELPETPAVLDAIKNFVKDHRYNVSEGIAFIKLYDDSEYTLESKPHPEPGVIPHISMESETRSIGFQSADELKGWLRCHRTDHWKR